MAISCLRRAILAATVPHLLSSQSSFAFAFVPLASCNAKHRSSAYSTPTPSLRSAYPSSSVLQMNSSAEKVEKNYIDKLALILINSKNQQLVARSYNRDVFYTPGGKREAGESDHQALLRECNEELAVDLTSSTKVPATIKPYGSFEAQAYGKPEGTMVRMTCFRVHPREAELELEQMVKASEEVEELKWIDSTFDREQLTVTGIMILDDLKEKGLIV